MSLKDEESEPLNKKQKCSGEELAAVPKIALLGGPMYDEATARKKLEMHGFDVDKLHECDGYVDEHFWGDDDDDEGPNIDGVTPLIYFCIQGDVRMCRYLLSLGASTTVRSLDKHWCPMYAAAYGGEVEVCKLLFRNGAETDIRKRSYGWTPFTAAAQNRNDELVRWLVLHGALCPDGSSDIIEGCRIYVKPYGDVNVWKKHTEPPVFESIRRLVEWAEDIIRTRSSLMTFLLGTLPPSPGKDQEGTYTSQYLSGQPGIRKNIAHFAGGLEVTRTKHLRILHSVMEVLPSFMFAR